jgi:hypothetical protein
MLRQQGVTASVVLADLLGQVRFDNCRTNGVHAHAFGRELQRHRFRETNNRELAGTVDWRAGVRAMQQLKIGSSELRDHSRARSASGSFVTYSG